jgi:hypothetical protein
MKISKVNPYERRTGSVSGSLRRVGRRIEWGGVELLEDGTPEGSLVVWVTEHDKNGGELSEEGTMGLIRAKRISVAAVVRQFMRKWQSDIRWEMKRNDQHHEYWLETACLLFTFQRVKDMGFEDVPGQTYEAYIEWEPAPGGPIPRITTIRKQETKP